MVKKSFMLNMKSQTSLNAKDNKNIVEISNNNNKHDNKKPQTSYTKVLVKNPFDNRDTILRLTKEQKGIYI